MARRTNRFQFTNKRHSRLGALSLVMGIISLVSLLFCILYAYILAGEIPRIMVMAGVLSVILGCVAFFESIRSRRDPDVFMTLPNVALVVSAIASLLWILIYIRGLIIMLTN